MASKEWTIAPLLLATAATDLSQVVLLSPVGNKVDGAVIAWLLTSGDDKILVDTGFILPEIPDERIMFTQTPDQTLKAQLTRFGTVPEDIRLVVNTHLHIDHCGGNTLLPNARFLAQKSELAYARDPLPAHRPAYDVDLAQMELELIEGDREIAEGVRTMLIPGHSPGSQAILIDTAEGLHIIAGDTITHYLSMDVPEGNPFLPGPIYLDLKEYYESLNSLKKLGGTILPGHDPLVFKRQTYP
jgi:N-acyl homoserine lactone hydrolase